MLRAELALANSWVALMEATRVEFVLECINISFKFWFTIKKNFQPVLRDWHCKRGNMSNSLNIRIVCFGQF